MDRDTIITVCWVLVTICVIVALLAEPGRWSL
jgi:hypothetical protein